MKLYHLKTSTRSDRQNASYVYIPSDLFLISFSTIRAAHRCTKTVASFLVVVVVAVTAVVVAVHLGSKQCDSNYTLSHELGSERSERVRVQMSAA